MLIGSITTLRSEDFPTQREWIGKLLFPINQFLLSATSAINGNITFGENIPCQTQALSFSYGGESNFPMSFKWSLAPKPVELRVCSAYEDGIPIIALVSWSYSEPQVSVAEILKLTSSGVSVLSVGSQYNLVLRGQP